ncbi:hypothetical protein AGLY_014358 [Aphis glycines]|uniref:Uncharacterized protein n=1 Tax=Aphis glycines TaxID=307491 RepID=A0A6G0T3R4_APHGL|nr:hypothetical protein AGLY_014358 [Aphis glycines]
MRRPRSVLGSDVLMVMISGELRGRVQRNSIASPSPIDSVSAERDQSTRRLLAPGTTAFVVKIAVAYLAPIPVIRDWQYCDYLLSLVKTKLANLILGISNCEIRAQQLFAILIIDIGWSHVLYSYLNYIRHLKHILSRIPTIGVLDKIFGAESYLPCHMAYLYNYNLSLVRGLSVNVTQVKLGTANIT